MSLYSSPAIRISNFENSESTMIQRKPGSTITHTRKPFVDRAVNFTTPDVNKKQKSDVLIKEPIKTTSSPPHMTEDLEIEPEYYFSYKEVEDQFVPYFKHLEEHHVFNILKNYIDYNTPPPSPTFMNAALLEPIEMSEEEYDCSFNSNESYEDYISPIENIDYEVEVPEIDIENL